jgi:hypothetical protein
MADGMSPRAYRLGTNRLPSEYEGSTVHRAEHHRRDHPLGCGAARDVRGPDALRRSGDRLADDDYIAHHDQDRAFLGATLVDPRPEHTVCGLFDRREIEANLGSLPICRGIGSWRQSETMRREFISCIVLHSATNLEKALVRCTPHGNRVEDDIAVRLAGDPVAEPDDPLDERDNLVDAHLLRSLSVPELAAKRRISEQSAARLVRRRRWQRRTDADSVIRILVPDATADTPNRPRGTQPAIEVLRMAVESLTERLRRADEDIRHERERADKADADARQAEARVQVLEVEVGSKLQAAQERAARAEGVRDAALETANRADARATAAEDRLADMERDNDARRALGRWARLRDAWRGRG